MRPISRLLLIVLLLFNAVGGFFGSISLLVETSGARFQITPELLKNSPFNDYLVPGILLLLINGILPAVAGLGLIFHRPLRPLPGLPFWRGQFWGWSLAFASGVGLMVWIAVQIAMIGFWRENPIQAVYGGLGLAITVLTQLPAVQRFYRL